MATLDGTFSPEFAKLSKLIFLADVTVIQSQRFHIEISKVHVDDGGTSL